MGDNSVDIVEVAYRKFCTKRFSLPAENEVLRVESRIGVALPDDYRFFLREHNGGFFNEPRIAPPTTDCPDDHLTCLHGIGAGHPVAELASDHDLALFDENYPVQVLPIGCTISGGLILLITCLEGRGRILLKEAFGESFYLCNGIGTFFGLLCEPTVGGWCVGPAALDNL